jgi:hypothetical protein
MREEEKCTQVWMEEWKELKDWAVLNAGGRMMLRWIDCEGGH